MDLKNMSIALFVKDIENSKNFYVKVLNQQIDLDFGKNVIFKAGFAIWEIRDNHIILEKIGLNKIWDYSVNRFELYFETNNIVQDFNDLKSKKVSFLHEIHEEIWGQQTIRFFDPDNHLIEIGESMQQFVTRIYKQGLTIEQVSARTFVPAEEVKRLIDIM
jgi:catechol 2,3-dioxygenase-like lactoylglutathione lyase family enzyme